MLRFWNKTHKWSIKMVLSAENQWRVRNLGIAFCGVPIVSNTLDKKYGKAQVPVEGGLYVMTHSSTHDKKKQLDKISKELNLGIVVDEI